jgi:hypothetical protein
VFLPAVPAPDAPFLQESDGLDIGPMKKIFENAQGSSAVYRELNQVADEIGDAHVLKNIQAAKATVDMKQAGVAVLLRGSGRLPGAVPTEKWDLTDDEAEDIQEGLTIFLNAKTQLENVNSAHSEQQKVLVQHPYFPTIRGTDFKAQHSSAVAFYDGFLGKRCAHWQKSFDEKVAELANLVGYHGLLDQPVILTDKQLQDQVLEAPTYLKVAPLSAALESQLDNLIELSSETNKIFVSAETMQQVEDTVATAKRLTGGTTGLSVIVDVLPVLEEKAQWEKCRETLARIASRDLPISAPIYNVLKPLADRAPKPKSAD